MPERRQTWKWEVPLENLRDSWKGCTCGEPRPRFIKALRMRLTERSCTRGVRWGLEVQWRRAGCEGTPAAPSTSGMVRGLGEVRAGDAEVRAPPPCLALQRLRAIPRARLDRDPPLGGRLHAALVRDRRLRLPSFAVDKSHDCARHCRARARFGGVGDVPPGRGDQAAARTRGRTERRVCQGAHQSRVRAGRLRDLRRARLGQRRGGAHLPSDRVKRGNPERPTTPWGLFAPGRSSPAGLPV